MVRKFEITKKLEQMRKTPGKGRFGNLLDDSVAILNLPEAFYCEKACANCMMISNMPALVKERAGLLPIDLVLSYISLFAEHHGTKFITINGRGDPFHPRIVERTKQKIRYAAKYGIRALVFTSGDNLTLSLLDVLARHKTNIVFSLFGNPFFDTDFFEKQYSLHEDVPILFHLLSVYKPEKDVSRLAFNYVVSEKDVLDASRLVALKHAIEERGFVLVCNMDFFPEKYSPEVRTALKKLTVRYSTNNTAHSTVVDGICQMGAGSSITIAANGDIYHCPYLVGNPDGNISELSPEDLNGIIERYQLTREYSCVFRKTPITSSNHNI